MAEYVNVNADKVRRLSVAIFCAHGLPEEDSKTVTDVLLTADLFGIESHGVQRMIRYHDALKKQQVVLHPKIEVIRDTPLSATLDAHQCLGHVAGTYAMRMAIDKAKQNGAGFVAVRNSTHYGIAGYYTAMALKERLIGLCATNSEQIGVPTYGVRPMFGTNPLAFAMPAKPYPFWFDAATTVVPRGKLEVYAKAEKTLPKEWCVNGKGENEPDPRAALDAIIAKLPGGILPLGGLGTDHGGHTGYGYALVAEILTSIFSGGLTSNHMVDGTGAEHTCQFFGAIDYGMFGDKDEMERHLSDYLQEIRDSDKASGQDRIYTHGEINWLSREQKLKDGIPLQTATVAELRAIAAELKIPYDLE